MLMLALRILLPPATSNVTEQALRCVCRRDGIAYLVAIRSVIDTGQAGDPVEVEAASSVLCGMRDGEPLIIGSVTLHFSFPLQPMSHHGTHYIFEIGLADSFGFLQIKSNIGHSECSAGISGLVKAVLAIEKGVIPGTPTFITPNPKSKLYNGNQNQESPKLCHS